LLPFAAAAAHQATHLLSCRTQDLSNNVLPSSAAAACQATHLLFCCTPDLSNKICCHVLLPLLTRQPMRSCALHVADFAAAALSSFSIAAVLRLYWQRLLTCCSVAH
jgi:hypothetical protein